MRVRGFVAALVPLLVAAAPVAAQQRPLKIASPATVTRAAAAPIAVVPKFGIELTGGVGTTVLDVNTWSQNKAGRPANNWGTIAYAGTARLILPAMPMVKLGVEVGYQYLFWYNYFPSGVTWVNEYGVTATHVAGMARISLPPRITVDIGAGVHFFNRAGTKIGALAAVYYHLPIAPTLDLVIGPRADAILADPMVIPIALNAGLGFHL